MTNSTTAAADPGIDPDGLLAVLVDGLEATEASIRRLQAVREAQLALAHRIADERCARDAAASSASSSTVPGVASELAHRAVAAEIAAVLHMSDRVVQGRMAQAAELVSRFPATLQALAEARIGLPHVRTIQDAGARLADDAVRARFETVAVAASVGETPHRARRAVQRAAEHLAPRSLTERHRDAQECRRVWREDLADGQKMLGLIHSAAVIDGIYDRLTQQARAVQVSNSRAATSTRTGVMAPGDEEGNAWSGDPTDARTLDQLRADLAVDTQLTGAPSGHDTPDGLLSAIRARVEITVPALTLIRATTDSDLGGDLGGERPGEFAGGQPIDTDTARILAAGIPGWERVLTHPLTGAVLAVDRYRPNADLRRLLHARDSRCRFPTCGLPPAAHDLDHTIDAAFGGATEEDNLGGCCRRHHVLKHHGLWTVKQLGAGVLEWTSPVGRTFIDRPPSPVTFIVSEPDPPPPSPPPHDQPPPDPPPPVPPPRDPAPW
ncbi:HNH endonuclease signature motif containing protein [Microbacterium sp. ASV81]|uniref:DUF222 domain-containing protein n=1 Tax=Microbacterium capsulatum TaxID=3041921 RepID=A0ABU0XHI2_9MICO|nr:DUF222 domain-containing protein [Microbacterium sp. ASV81]MDQ4214587.1 DUF222 domain-containing protein [Microbacterium sp. ASV81]